MIAAKVPPAFEHKKVMKPQELFSDKVDNSNLPFLPKLRTKPNAIEQLPGKYYYIVVN